MTAPVTPTVSTAVGSFVLKLVLVVALLAGAGALVKHEISQAAELKAKDAAMVAHLHADSVRERAADSVGQRQQLALDSVVNATPTVDDTVRKLLALVQTYEVTQGKNDTAVIVHVVKPAPPSDPVPALEHACSDLVVHDSLLAVRAGESGSACAQRVAARDSIIADARKRLALLSAAPSVPRFTASAGGGWGLGESKPFGRAIVELHVLGPVSVQANLDVMPGVTRPVEGRVAAVWRVF